ncbi:MAG: ATP-binding protein [Telluria sp.]
MKSGLWLRFLAISVACALVLSVAFLFLLRGVTGRPTADVQRSIYLFLAHMVEQRPYAQALDEVQRLSADSPAMPLELWVIDGRGTVLAATAATDLPTQALAEPLPAQPHALRSVGHFFAGARAVGIVRLAGAEPAWLVVRNRGGGTRGAWATVLVLFVLAMCTAVFGGLVLVTVYLRGRSRSARRVIADLEAGNLKSRFAIDRLDSLGHLMLDFNRMADEIERLVRRLEAIEATRRELLQELAHDLRTPLTSLRTSIDTLSAHGARMSEAERTECLQLAANEIGYFTQLIDDLFFIAQIDQPRYRKQTHTVHLAELAQAEVRAAAAACPALTFAFAADATGLIEGDPYLLARLLRNVLDNAARHARAEVRVRLCTEAGNVQLMVEDDGAGMSAQEQADFGSRRQRKRVVASGANIGASLGLGAVIIRTVVELHGARLHIDSPLGPDGGTRMCLDFTAIAAA